MAPAPGRGRRQMKAGVANICGERHYLLRSVDHEGEVLEAYAGPKRDNVAALECLRRAMERCGVLQALGANRGPSYRAAMMVNANEGRQETGRHLNDRALNSHQPFRR